MTCIHLHLGQAGIQLGESFWALAEEEFLVHGGGKGSVHSGKGGGGARVSSTKPPMRMRPGGTAMFHEDGGWARCLAVDSEPKVVQGFQRRVESLRPENAIFSQSGLANNWGMGFASCRSDVAGEEGPFSRCMEGMRKEAERCSWLNSVVMTHSLAGGTGSGLGSGVLQALRDEYPSLYLISACVGAFGAGDTPLQHYNSVLALQHLQAYADCVIYRGNDDLLRGAAEASTRRTIAAAAATSDSQRAVGGGYRSGGGNRGRGWRPVGLLSSQGGDSNGFGGGGGGRLSAYGRGGTVVSTADMNVSLALDMASYFFPTSRPFDRYEPAPPRVSGHSRQRQQQQRQRPEQQETAPRPFDGGSLMAAAVPLPAAKFVDLRSSLSIGPTAAACGGQDFFSTSPLSLSWSATKDWAALANELGRRTPLCPRRAGGVDDDACVAAHYLARGATFGSAGETPTTGVHKGGGRAGATAGRRSTHVDPSGRRRNKGVDGVGMISPGAAAATAPSVCLQVGEALRRHHECQEWRTSGDACSAPALRSRGVLRSVTTVCNQTRIRWVLGDVVAKAEEKFRARAYLHWYHRHGLEDEDFLEAFEGVRTVKRGYDGLARAFGGGGSGNGESTGW